MDTTSGPMFFFLALLVIGPILIMRFGRSRAKRKRNPLFGLIGQPKSKRKNRQ